jgi:2'-5' RNA ligase
MHRLFVAIRPPQDVRDLLIDAMDDSPALRWVGEDNLHLTLCFIGEVERPVANDIAAALERLRSPAFQMRINGVGKFEQRNGGALWAAVEPKEPAAALAGKVERALQQAGLEPERRAYHLSPPQRQPRFRPVRSRPLHPLRKPPLPPRRALRRSGAIPAGLKALEHPYASTPR